MKPIALQLYSLRREAQTDFLSVLRTVAEIGYVGVEPAGTYGMEAAEVRKTLDDLGLICCSTHGPLPTAETVARRIDEAGALGTDTLISGLGAKNFASAEACDETFEKINQAAGLVAAEGMKFGYHNHWGEMNVIDGRYAWERMLEQVPGIFAQLDIYWAANFGAVDVPALIAKHAGRIVHLHVKDGPLTDPKAPHTAVGAGKMDIPACIAAADESVLEWNIVELDECATDMTQAVRESCSYLVGEGLARGKK